MLSPLVQGGVQSVRTRGCGWELGPRGDTAEGVQELHGLGVQDLL